MHVSDEHQNISTADAAGVSSLESTAVYTAGASESTCIAGTCYMYLLLCCAGTALRVLE